jgi:hypothetical protein
MVKARLVGIVLFCVFATSGLAATSSPSLIATPPQPKWSELTVMQKIVLAPLSDDWDSLEYYRQKKWLGIAGRFSTMAPEEQRRIQAQMQEWGKLTPEQRQVARENFKTASQLPTEKKQELRQKWEEYSNLPEDEKEKLKQQAASKPAARPSLSPTPPAPLPAPAVPATPAAATAPAAATTVTDTTARP